MVPVTSGVTTRGYAEISVPMTNIYAAATAFLRWATSSPAQILYPVARHSHRLYIFRLPAAREDQRRRAGIRLQF